MKRKSTGENDEKKEKPPRRHIKAVINEEERQLRKEMHRKCECVIYHNQYESLEKKRENES